MKKSAIILAGGISSRLGQDKGLIELAGKPLIRHVLGAVGNSVDEKIVVVSSRSQAEKYERSIGHSARILCDVENSHTPLVGAFTGLESARGAYSLLVSCDAPFMQIGVISFLFEISAGRNAVIPRWPNGYIEPLMAVYSTKVTAEAAKTVLSEGGSDMKTMISRLCGIRYVSTLVLQQLDPELKTFLNINTLTDLKRAERKLATKRS